MELIQIGLHVALLHLHQQELELLLNELALELIVKIVLIQRECRILLLMILKQQIVGTVQNLIREPIVFHADTRLQFLTIVEVVLDIIGLAALLDIHHVQ